MIRIILLCFALSSICHADDVYLQNGFVMRNVEVTDSTNGVVTIKRDGRKILVAAEDVLRIEQREVSPDQKSAYELFSRDLYERYQRAAPEREKLARERRRERETSRTASMADSIQRAEAERDRLHPWGRSLFLAGGWGIPQGFRFELGYNFGWSVSLGLALGTGERWSRDPGQGTFGILGCIRFPIKSSTIAPYLLVSTGSSFNLFGNSDSFTLIYLGTMLPFRPWLQLRPELGVAFTSKHVSGGQSLFGGSTPRVTDNDTRFGAHLGVEIDFRQAF